MPRARTTRRRTARRPARRTASRGRDVPINVSLGIMGDGVHNLCVKKGSNVKELFKLAGFKIAGDVRLNGRLVTGDARITTPFSSVTCTANVRQGV